MIAFLTTKAQAVEKSEITLDKSRCKENEKCVCYGQNYLTAIEEFYKKATECQSDIKHARITIDELKKFGKDKEPQWYQEPGVIAGGILISFSFGALLTYLVVKQ